MRHSSSGSHMNLPPSRMDMSLAIRVPNYPYGPREAAWREVAD